MTPLLLRRATGLIAALALTLTFLLAGCAAPPAAPRPDALWAGRDLGGFPYHPLAFHLDLSILAYQLHSQTLVWPFDPYYEELADEGERRAAYMARVRDWAKTQGAAQQRNRAGLQGYRGPGVLGGFDDNPLHDPILYQYGRLNPWGAGIANPLDRWTEYLTPVEITGRIADSQVCYRPAGGAPDAVVSEPLRAERRAWPDARDRLFAFEGGTGDKGEAGQPPSQSIMGFVLLRTTPGGRYDVHIAFRGSRSGSGSRALWQALSTAQASGNPDWITDLGYRTLSAPAGGAPISRVGEVSRGFARSMQSIFPALFHCLGRLAESARGAGPEHIYVTGHSLGGALAQHFVSAVLLGDRYGPRGGGAAMPAALRGWPWPQIKLITYSAPRAGDARWAEALTRSGLDSEFFSAMLNPLDADALASTDPGIVTRLLDARRPAGYRVLVSSDPLTTEKVPGGKHVGKTVYVDEPTLEYLLAPPDFEAHEPLTLRRKMLRSLADPRTPALAWRYRDVDELVPDRIAGQRGSARELRKLADAVIRYHAEHGLWLDRAAFDEGVDLRLSIDAAR